MKRYYILTLTTISLIFLIKLVLPEPLDNKESVNLFWSNKTHTTNKFDIIACGDSRIYRSISSDISNEVDSNLSFINLGYSSAGLNDKYLDFVTSKFLPKSKYKTLVIGISPYSLTVEAKKNEALNSFLEFGDFDKFRYRYLSPILKHFAPFKPTEIIKNKRKDYIQNFNDDGWVASDKASPDSSYALKSYRKNFSNYKITQEDMVSTVNKLKEIASTGVNIIAFRIPTTEQMEKLEDSISGFDEAFIKKELIEYSITYLDFKNSDFVSYDGSHLNESSARKLTNIIGKKIKELYLTKPKLH